MTASWSRPLENWLTYGHTRYSVGARYAGDGVVIQDNSTLHRVLPADRNSESVDYKSKQFGTAFASSDSRSYLSLGIKVSFRFKSMHSLPPNRVVRKQKA